MSIQRTKRISIQRTEKDEYPDNGKGRESKEWKGMSIQRTEKDEFPDNGKG